ncbi:30598_t:CDS:2, partial [Gigaspora margarita]
TPPLVSVPTFKKEKQSLKLPSQDEQSHLEKIIEKIIEKSLLKTNPKGIMLAKHPGHGKGAHFRE